MEGYSNGKMRIENINCPNYFMHDAVGENEVFFRNLFRLKHNYLDRTIEWDIYCTQQFRNFRSIHLCFLQLFT